MRWLGPGSNKNVRIDIFVNYNKKSLPWDLLSRLEIFHHTLGSTLFWWLLFICITFPGLTAYSFSVRRDHWSPSKICQQPEIVPTYSLLIVIDPAELLTTAWTNSGHNMILVLKKLNRFCSKSISEVTLSLPPICVSLFTACQIAVEASNLKKNN